ncbi:MMPL family transporter [Nocardioides sp. YIM 152315]|uniref:MMPL family transporter n=1 Tax=Nocardioides sp. YIM 152315 TaxID=3031760 RepID=UPI0023DC25D6|nr:MMPL family transporter [Nocardioides sp. YIM 152315]MDF1605306.1 MMPL family transporter [Nocardioides sp. YIM 152315]
MIDRWGGFVARRAVLVLLTGALLVLGAGAYGSGVFDSLSQGGFDDSGSESARELDAARATFGNRSVDVVAIYSSDDLTADDAEFRGAVEDVVAGLSRGTTAQVVPYWSAPDAGLVAEDGHAAQVLISLAGDSQDDYLDHYDEIEPSLEAEGLDLDLAGPFAVYDDVNEITSEDLERAELISMPLVILLALLIFGSLVAATMPAMVGVVAMVGALAVVRLLTTVTEVSVFAVNVISLLGIGLAIDYALFVVSRFREELALLPDDHPDAPAIAIRRTMATAGRTVMFSGLTVAAALASLLIFPQAFLKSMGYGGIAAVLVAMLAALTILPATLRLLGRRIDAGRLPWRRHRAVAGADEHGRWARLARAVMRRPVVVIVVTVAALLVVASPFLGARWGSVDHRVLPEDAPAHQAQVLLDDEFGAETSTASLLLEGTSERDVAAYEREVERVDGIGSVTPVDRAGGTTLLRATWEGNSQTERSQDIVTALREIEPRSGTALVGGLTADTVDLISSVGAHLPWMGLIVLVVMLGLLFLAFGSVVLPVKAVVMNLVSITASFGVVTWIFSDGHLADRLGFVAQGYLDATMPILMLAILFGLSMDYEVFLLSRIREQWDATHDNDLSVVTGVQKTGRIITSAALLLAVVIGAFGLSGIVFMKMLGIGMLVALLIDATVVRAVLVPATMRLLGRWNWYAPAPLARWWERHGFRETETPVDDAAEVTGVT